MSPRIGLLTSSTHQRKGSAHGVITPPLLGPIAADAADAADDADADDARSRGGEAGACCGHLWQICNPACDPGGLAHG